MTVPGMGGVKHRPERSGVVEIFVVRQPGISSPHRFRNSSPVASGQRECLSHTQHQVRVQDSGAIHF